MGVFRRGHVSYRKGIRETTLDGPVTTDNFSALLVGRQTWSASLVTPNKDFSPLKA